MPNLEFAVPMRLETPGGTVLLNVADPDTGRIYIVRYEGYEMLPALRVTQDNISQADGSVLHPRWTSGMVASFKVGYYVKTSETDEGVDVVGACGLELQEMHQALIAALNSIRRYRGSNQRYFWTPTDYGDDRLLDQIQLLSWPNPDYELDGLLATVSFSVESPFPYAIDATEKSTDIASTDTEVLVNAGDAPESPVIRVYGPTSAFTITTVDDVDESGVPLMFSYLASRPGGVAIGASSYAEIDFFRGTIFLNGSGADLIAGVDPTLTDFFHLNPGNNSLTIAGADCTVLYNNAWA